MTQLLREAYNLAVMFGIDLIKTIYTIRSLPAYYRDLKKLKSQAKSFGEDFPLGTPYPCLFERSANSGAASGHYFHQDLLVARRIFLNAPRRHVDVGSSVYGFVSHVASFREIEVIDIRPLPGKITNIKFTQADMMTHIGDELINYCDSVSCLHALEHFGLGRYGDPVQYDGHLRGLDNLYRMLTPGGKLYISVPIGPQRIEFNAHRVFSVAYMLGCFGRKYCLDQISYVDDRGDLHEDIPISGAAVQKNFGCYHGCGIFELTKI